MVRSLLCLACTLSIAGCTDQAKLAALPTPPAVETATLASVAEPEETSPTEETTSPPPTAPPMDEEARQSQSQKDYDALQAEFQQAIKNQKCRIQRRSN